MLTDLYYNACLSLMEEAVQTMERKTRIGHIYITRGRIGHIYPLRREYGGESKAEN